MWSFLKNMHSHTVWLWWINLTDLDPSSATNCWCAIIDQYQGVCAFPILQNGWLRNRIIKRLGKMLMSIPLSRRAVTERQLTWICKYIKRWWSWTTSMSLFDPASEVSDWQLELSPLHTFAFKPESWALVPGSACLNHSHELSDPKCYTADK